MNSFGMDNTRGHSTIRLVVVTRYQLDGDALAALFHTYGDFLVICATTNTKVATSVCGLRNPDAVLLDGSLRELDEDQSLEVLTQQLGQTPVLILDDDVNNGRLTAALATPCTSYFTRGNSFSELADGLRQMAHGARVFDPAVRSRIRQTQHGWQFYGNGSGVGSDLSRLTQREIEVLKLIAQGNSVKNCAELMKLAPSTVDNHKARLMKKLGIHKSLELIRLAIREGLVQV